MFPYFKNEKVDPVLEQAKRNIRVLEKMLKEADERLFLTVLTCGFVAFIIGLFIGAIITNQFVGGL